MALTYSSVVDAPLGEVFAWHARPGAVARLMPPWLPVRVEREALRHVLGREPAVVAPIPVPARA